MNEPIDDELEDAQRTDDAAKTSGPPGDAETIARHEWPSVVASASADVEHVEQKSLAHRAGVDAGWLRLVIVVWCFWLLGAWALAWVSDTSVPRVRWMLFAGSFGLMVVWPAFRLSERSRVGEPGGGAAGPVLLDWLGLMMVHQAVIWSLHLIAGWPLERGLWLDAAVVSWSLLTALIVAAARRYPGGLARSIGMLLCIALVFGEPIAVWLASMAGQPAWSMRVSPIQAMWELTQPPSSSGGIEPWDQRTMVIGLLALSGWAVLGAWSIGERLLTRRRDTEALSAAPNCDKLIR